MGMTAAGSLGSPEIAALLEHATRRRFPSKRLIKRTGSRTEQVSYEGFYFKYLR